MNKREIEEQAIIAFGVACDNGYISTFSSVKDVEDNAYEILGWMPDYEVDELTEEDFDYAVEVLISQLD